MPGTSQHEQSPNPADFSALVSAEVTRQIGLARTEIEGARAEIRERTVDNRATIVVFSGDLDKVLAAYVIATGAAAMGLETSMFFTFWGLSALKRKGARSGKKKNVAERLFGLMTPSSSESLAASKMNFMGAGARMLRGMMKDKEIASLEELMALARELGVKSTVCAMSMDVMGISADELVEGVEIGGVAAYLGDAARSKVTLFI